MMRLAPLALAIALSGCAGSNGDTGEVPWSATPDDCVTVDGASGFGSLQEAVDAAAEGGTVLVCAASREGAVIVDKDLTIEGASSAESQWTAPLNEVNLTITSGAQVTLRNLGLRSSRTAIVVEADSKLIAEGIDVLAAGQYGISGTNATLSLVGGRIGPAEWGGVKWTGGTVTVDGTLFEGSRGSGLRLDLGADATVAGATFRLHRSTSTTTSINDGWGLWVLDGASATVVNTTFADNILGGADVEGGGALTVEDSTFSGGLVGLWADNSPLDVRGTTVEDYRQYGLVALSSPTVSIVSSTFATSPEESALPTDDSDGSIGILSQDSPLVLETVSVSGNNQSGVYVERAFKTALDVTLTDVTVTDNARFGVALYGADATLVDVDITGLRSDPACVTGTNYSCNFGLLGSDAQIDWAGGNLTDNAGFGSVIFSGALTLDDLTVARNLVYGATLQDSALAISNTTFSEGRQASLSIAAGSYAEIEDTTFSGGTTSYRYPSTSTEGVPNEWVYFLEAIDLSVYDSTLILDRVDFSDGEQGVQGRDSVITLRDVDFTNYNEFALYLYGLNDIAGTKVDAARVKFSNIGGYATYCSDAAFVLDKVTYDDVNEIDYSTEYYENDVLVSATQFSYTAPAFYGNGCALTLSDVSFKSVKDRALNLFDSSLDASDLLFEDVATQGFSSEGAVTMRWYDTAVAPTVYIDGLSLKGPTAGWGLYLDADPGIPEGTVVIEDVDLGDPEGIAPAAPTFGSGGLAIHRIANATIRGLSVADTTTAGLELISAELTIDGDVPSVLGRLGGDGLTATDSTLAIDGLEIRDPQLDGIKLTGGTSSWTHLLVASPGGAGIVADAGEHSFSDSVVVEEAGTYGLSCLNAPTFPVCDPTLSGALAEQDGCAEACP